MMYQSMRKRDGDQKLLPSLWRSLKGRSIRWVAASLLLMTLILVLPMGYLLLFSVRVREILRMRAS